MFPAVKGRIRNRASWNIGSATRVLSTQKIVSTASPPAQDVPQARTSSGDAIRTGVTRTGGTAPQYAA
jgi:hypothetical protein